MIVEEGVGNFTGEVIIGVIKQKYKDHASVVCIDNSCASVNHEF